MDKMDINQVVADALTRYMGTKWNDSTLGRKAGVAPNTVKNCRVPKNRVQSATGKVPSITLTQLAKIAAALDVDVVDMVTPVESSAERTDYMRWKAMKYFEKHGVLPSWTPAPETPQEAPMKHLPYHPKAA